MTQLLQQQLVNVQQRQKFQSHKHRSKRSFGIGDLVYLFKTPALCANSVTPGANYKISFRYFGPYQIMAKTGSFSSFFRFFFFEKRLAVLLINYCCQRLPLYILCFMLLSSERQLHPHSRLALNFQSVPMMMLSDFLSKFCIVTCGSKATNLFMKFPFNYLLGLLQYQRRQRYKG
jgi:hypothetical protein